MTSAAERRQQVLERARHRRRRQTADRDQAELRRALVIGGTVGLASGVVLGQLLWVDALAGPAVAAVLGLALGVAGGAGLVYSRELAGERAREAEAARQRAEERARQREEARRERRSPPAAAKPPVPVEVGEADDDDFLVPPGFYPDPGGGKASRWWDGTRWTGKVRAPTAA
jgi:Protein of unknown function (DUF2510)